MAFCRPQARWNIKTEKAAGEAVDAKEKLIFLTASRSWVLVGFICVKAQIPNVEKKSAHKTLTLFYAEQFQ